MVQLDKVRMVAVAEQCEEVAELQPPDRGELELEQRSLPRVGVHREDLGRRGQCVIERIAARTRDNQHAIIGGQVERQAIYSGVFPTRVVKQRSGIDRVEQLLIELVGQSRFPLHGAPRPAKRAGCGQAGTSLPALCDAAVTLPQAGSKLNQVIAHAFEGFMCAQ